MFLNHIVLVTKTARLEDNSLERVEIRVHTIDCDYASAIIKVDRN